MTDHETEIRTQLQNERENAEIVRRYEQAVEDGCAAWRADGGLLSDAIETACRKNGVVK